MQLATYYKKNLQADDLTPYAIYKTEKKDDKKVSQLYLDFDTIIEISYTRNIEITDYPFIHENEKTKETEPTRITEYMYNMPDIIEMKGIKSFDSLLTGAILNALDIQSAVDKIRQQLDILTEGIYKLQILTKNGVRKYFTLIKYTMPENLENYNYLEVDMTFKQVLSIEDWNQQQRNEEDNNTQNSGNVPTQQV